MKILLLVRHAKSSWGDLSAPDHERPLNDRGKKNAPDMAKRLLKRKVPVDCFISSHAKRALTTAAFFAKAYGVETKEILVTPELYMANESAFLKVIREAPDSAASIAVFSHNNGITSFAKTLSSARIDHMPTCGIFAVKCRINHWSEFVAGDNEFYFFDFPKAV